MKFIFWRRRINDEVTFNEAFRETSGDPGRKTIESWSDEQLHRALSGNFLKPIPRAFAEGELERRKGWRTPAKWSLIVSVAALAASFISIVISIFDK